MSEIAGAIWGLMFMVVGVGLLIYLSLANIKDAIEGLTRTLRERK